MTLKKRKRKLTTNKKKKIKWLVSTEAILS